MVVDRLVKREGIERRLTDSLETALRLAEGVAEAQLVPREEEPPRDDDTLTFSQHLACPTCGLSFDELAPRNFSFNSPYGCCPNCDGLGTRFEVDPDLVVRDPELSIEDGAITPWGRAASTSAGCWRPCARPTLLSTQTPWRSLKKSEQKVVLYGTGTKKVHVQYRNRYGRVRSYDTQYEGVVPWLSRRYAEAESDHARGHRGLHARSALPGLRRSAAQAGEPGGDGGRPQHLRAVRPVASRCHRLVNHWS